MAVKTITITVEAYNALSRAKHAHESFSETVRRLADRSVPLTDFAGAWADAPEDRVKEIERFLETSGRMGWTRMKHRSRRKRTT